MMATMHALNLQNVPPPSEPSARLWAAARAGNAEELRRLATAHVNYTHPHWRTTALMEAADNGHHEALEHLLKRKASVNAHTQEGETALIKAAKKDHCVCVALLIGHNAKLTSLTRNEFHTPLYMAAFAGACNAVKIIYSLDHQRKEHTAIFAAAGNQVPILEYLVSVGADMAKPIMLPSESHERRLLHRSSHVSGNALTVALACGHLEATLFLLRLGLRLDIHDDHTILMLKQAAHAGCGELVELLLNHGIHPDACEASCPPDLVLDMSSGFLHTVSPFTLRASRHAQHDPQPAIFHAVQGRDMGVLNLLVRRGAVNVGEAFIYAAGVGFVEAVEALLPLVRDDAVKCHALICAGSSGNAQLVQMLQKSIDPTMAQARRITM